jgi:hypothetical protein
MYKVYSHVKCISMYMYMHNALVLFMIFTYALHYGVLCVIVCTRV